MRPLGSINTLTRPYAYFPLQSTYLGFDYTNIEKVTDISFEIYNAQSEEKNCYVGMVFTGKESYVQELGVYTLTSGWNTIHYKVNREIMPIGYDLTKCYAMAVGFDRYDGVEFETSIDVAPVFYMDMDPFGNVSETKWIELNVTVPTATIERDKNTNKYRITWDGSSTGRLNDNPYNKGTWISDEGEYTFVITNNSNRSNTYHFTIAHAFVVLEVVEPTCTERGYTIYKCLSCDTTYNANYVDELGHDYDSVLVGETCTEGAYYLYTCKVCGHQYKSEYITQGGHKYTTKTTAPTCTERGYTTYTCSVCGYSFRDDFINARGHSYRTTVTAPTCTEVGFTHYECKNCDYEYNADYIPAHGHNYETKVVEPTCAERGHTLHKCSYCGDEYKTDETLALGHNYTETRLKQVVPKRVVLNIPVLDADTNMRLTLYLHSDTNIFRKLQDR